MASHRTQAEQVLTGCFKKCQQAENNSRDTESPSPVILMHAKHTTGKTNYTEGFAQVTLKIVNNGYF